MRDAHRHAGVCTAGPGNFIYGAPAPATTSGRGRSASGLVLDRTVPAGRHHDLILEISDETCLTAHQNPVTPGPPPKRVARRRSRAGKLPHSAGRATLVRGARGLTSRTGGMVAAATTSLPERAETGRNYDYRNSDGPDERSGRHTLRRLAALWVRT